MKHLRANQSSPRGVRAFFIVNPTAGGGRGLEVWREVERALPGLGIAADHRLTHGPGTATELAAAACRAGHTLVVGIGGDGTIQEIVNGLVGADGRSPATLAIIPGGTGNDFSKMLGIPRDSVEALTTIFQGQTRRLDLGRAYGGTGDHPRYFVNIAGVGFDAEVAAFLNRRPKRLPAVLTYVYGALVILARYRPVRARITLDDRVLERRCLLVSVCNGHAHAGGMRMCPEAKPDDGLLDICIAGDLGRLETLTLLPKVFSGRHTRHAKVELYTTKTITIEGDQPLFVQADGEILGRVPVKIEVVPGALEVVGPAAVANS